MCGTVPTVAVCVCVCVCLCVSTVQADRCIKKLVDPNYKGEHCVVFASLPAVTESRLFT